MPNQVITANRLSDGRVVWLAVDGHWVEDIAASAVLAEQSAVEAALARSNPAVSEREVVEPYATDVEVVGDRVVPKSLRERIRAEGPTVAGAFTDEARRSLA